MGVVQSISAVVFAYHDVGVRCLSVLLAQGVKVELIVTHEDDPGESIWWESVASLAIRENIPVLMPDDPNQPEIVERVLNCKPDILFSFYYRHLLNEHLLGIPRIGAFNMHGSLLPSYRGRVPINWAILNGESQTGASLHRMVLSPDAGALVSQRSVSILPNDTALSLFRKVTCAAEEALIACLPRLLVGMHDEQPLDLAKGSYFGRRTADDGRIDWSANAWRIHNLVRAVAPPYPGAFFEIAGHRLALLGSYWRGEKGRSEGPRLYWDGGRCYADCADGKRFEVTELKCDGERLTEDRFTTLFGVQLICANLLESSG